MTGVAYRVWARQAAFQTLALGPLVPLGAFSLLTRASLVLAFACLAQCFNLALPPPATTPMPKSAPACPP